MEQPPQQPQPEQQVQISNLPTAESLEDIERAEHMMEISDKIFQLIISSIQKKPETAAEALALVAYIYEKDIGPLLTKLRVWALSELKAEIVQIQEHVQEKMRKGWCVPRSAHSY